MGKVLSNMRLEGSYMHVKDLEKGIQQAKYRAEKRKERKTLEEMFMKLLKATIGIIPATQESLEQFEQLLQDDQLKRLEELVEEMKFWDAANTIPEPKSFLYHAHLQPLLIQMLEDIVPYSQYLKRFIIRFQAENENTAPRHNTKSKSDATNPSAPIHYAVVKLNEDFLEWLLAHPNIDVNLRDNNKRTALMLLCEKYDQCMRKSVPGSNLPSHIQDLLATIRTLIRKLLLAGADFNICNIRKQLPIELLLKHRRHDETRLFFDECVKIARCALAIIYLNKYNECVVGFFNKTSPLKVTVELLEIFLRYYDEFKFIKHMRDFQVNETNVKKVIRLLLHAACDNKLEYCVRLILDRGEEYIFMEDSNIALLMQSKCVANYDVFDTDRICSADVGTLCSPPPRLDRSSEDVDPNFIKITPSPDTTSVVEEPNDATNKPTELGSGNAVDDPNNSPIEPTYPGSGDAVDDPNNSPIEPTYPGSGNAVDDPNNSPNEPTYPGSGNAVDDPNNSPNEPTYPGSGSAIDDPNDYACERTARGLSIALEDSNSEPEVPAGSSSSSEKYLSMMDRRIRGYIPFKENYNRIVFANSKVNPYDDKIIPTAREQSSEDIDQFLYQTFPHFPDTSSTVDYSKVPIPAASMAPCDRAQHVMAHRSPIPAASMAPNAGTSEPIDPGLSIAFQNLASRKVPYASEQKGLKRKKVSVMAHRVELKGLLKKICLMGNLSLLQRFLAKISDPILLNDDPLLVHTLRKAYYFKHSIWEQKSLLACAEHLATQEGIHVSKKDNSGNTSLHLALNYGFDSVARLLLHQRCSYLGTRNKDNETPVDYGTYDFWKKYLDTCIEVDWKRLMPNCDEIYFNLNGFCSPLQDKTFPIVPNPTVNDDGIASANCWKMIQPVDETYKQPQSSINTDNEMTILRKISKSKEHMRLLIHPVLYTFIMVKWARVCHWNYLNLLLTALTIVFFGYYSVTACSAEGSNPVWLLFSILGIVFVGIRELLQLLFLRRSYLSFVDVFDIAIAIAMIMVLVFGCNGLMSSFVIISLAMQMSFMIGSLQSNNIATIMYMFKTVSKNFLKSFALFSPLIGAFVYAFHLTYNQSPEEQKQVCDTDDCAEDNFNNFRTFWNATVKTLVMTTGEFEAAAFDFEGGKVLLFIVFVFVAPIVILNLINGLAVSDIAAIREESELISISKKVMLLEQYERGVANVRPAFLKRCFPKPFFSEYQCRIHIKTKEYNKIVVHAKAKSKQPPKRLSNVRNREYPKLNTIPLRKSLSKFPWLLKSDSCNYVLQGRFFRLPLFVNLDQSIVNEALAVIKKRTTEEPASPVNKEVALVYR